MNLRHRDHPDSRFYRPVYMFLMVSYPLEHSPSKRNEVYSNPNNDWHNRPSPAKLRGEEESEVSEVQGRGRMRLSMSRLDLPLNSAPDSHFLRTSCFDINCRYNTLSFLQFRNV